MGEEITPQLERVARAIYKLSPARQPWDGDGYAFDEPEARFARERAYRMARAAVAAMQEGA